MRQTLLLSAAAVALSFGLAATTNAASAQTKSNPEPAPAAQQNAPPAKIAPPINAGDGKASMKSDTSGQAASPPVPGHIAADEQNSNRSTTGQGAAAGSAKLSSEQRSQITSVIKKQSVKPAQVNFAINVGTRVPPEVHYYPLPTEVVTIYPEWRGYNYILVGGQVLVIDPDTREIVAILGA